MSSLFKLPTWDEDVQKKSVNYNFNKSAGSAQKRVKLTKSRPSKVANESSDGKFVRIRRGSDDDAPQRADVVVEEKSRRKRVRKGRTVDDSDSEVPVPHKKTKSSDAVAKSDDTPKSTTFRESLAAKLKGSRFRFINEQLYKIESTSAKQIFSEDDSAFEAYHDGYRHQVDSWPMNPLDRLIKTIRKLPKDFVVADFGCGEARLAQSIAQKVYSLDLCAVKPEIIVSDMANTPLQSNSINVAVYCLSLMATNLKDIILEANRVLKTGFFLKIAEVESRIVDVTAFIKHIESCGFKLMNKDLTHKLFYFLNFKKMTNIASATAKSIESFSLKPCLYKKR